MGLRNLGHLCAEETTGEEMFRSYDGQRNMMLYACCRSILEQVARRRLEELQHRRVLPGGGVRHVNDHRRTVQRFGQALTCN